MNSALRSHGWLSITTALIIAGVIAGILVRLPFLEMLSHDIIGNLGQWYDYIVLNGGIYALGDRFAEYTPAYLYLLTATAYVREIALPMMSKVAAIKLPSIAADFLMAAAAYNIVKTVMRGRGQTANLAPAIAFIAVLLLPTVVINSAVWGQADGMYTAGVLWCIYFLCAKRPALAMAAFGIAVAIKLQAVFIAPLFLYLLLRRQLRVTHLLIVPTVYAALMLPAILLGRPPLEALGSYIVQAGEFHSLSMGAPNFYLFVPEDLYTRGVQAGLVIGVIAGLMISLAFAQRRDDAGAEDVLLCALVCVMVMPFVLPKLHERYFFPADVLSMIVAIVATMAVRGGEEEGRRGEEGKGERWRWQLLILLPIAYQLISLSAYATVLQALAWWNRFLPDVKVFTWLNFAAIVIVVPMITLWRARAGDARLRQRVGLVLGIGTGVMAAIVAALIVTMAMPGGRRAANWVASPGTLVQSATATAITYGDAIELVGYYLPRQRTFRTGIMKINLFFKPLRPLTKEYRLRIDAFALDGRSLELFNESPADEAPLSAWQPGEIYQQMRYMTIWTTVDAPQLATFKVSWIDPQTGAALPATRDGVACDPKVAVIPIGLDYGTVATWLRAPPIDTFGAGQELELLNAAAVDVSSARQSVVVTTTWRLASGAQTLGDLTFFVHMISPDGKMVAQVDAQPRGGAYPTQVWHPGEVVVDAAQLALPAELPAGQYRLQLGVYRSDTQVRLPAYAMGGDSNRVARLPDDVVVLSELKVQR